MKYKYKLSIIMSVYNVEQYLDEAVQSILNQDIGFEKNVQLILVNDGSVDGSEKICLKYQKQFPNNIVYKKKPNGGLSSAKNLGLDFIEGELVNFFDSDDTLPSNTLSEVYKFYKANEKCIDFVTIPLCFFEAQTGYHVKYKYMGDKNKVINLLKEPYNFVLSGAASFYKKEVFDNFRFDESYFGEEDTLLNGLLYLKNPRFGYVCEKGVKYNYRKRFTKNSIVDISRKKVGTYHTVVKLLNNIIPKTNLKEYHQEMIIYELRSRIKEIRKSIFESEDEYNKIIDEYIKYIKLINPDYLLYNSMFCNTIELKYAFACLGEIDKEKLEDFLLNSSNIMLQRNEIKDGILYTDLTYNNFGFDDIDVVAVSNGNIIQPVSKDNFNSSLDIKVGEVRYDKTHLRRFEFKLSEHKHIEFFFSLKKSEYLYRPVKVKAQIRDTFNAYNRYYYYKNYRVVFDKRNINISKPNHLKLLKFIRNIRTILAVLKNKRVLPLTRLLKCGKPRYILINDRLNKAGDNGEALFKYINNHRPSLAKKTYFVISKNSPDYRRIKKYGKVVATGSLKHKRLFLNTAYIYSSHMMPEFYNAYKEDYLRLYRDLFEYKFIWLQHGITQADISNAANRYVKHIDYVITATKSELDEFSQKKYCYDKNQILLTGFARYDLLKDDSKNIITISPTWRRMFENVEREEFVKSNYYENYSSLLGDKKLVEKLKENNIKLNLVLHPEMVEFIDDFKKYENNNITVVRPENAVYSDIFSESKLLITDYSSVFFDFAYLKKPLIYFQFDEKEYYAGHYMKGYFDFRKDSFGDVCTNYKNVVDKIVYFIDNDFKMEDKYIKRVNKTFEYNDQDNSKRILDQTLNK